MLVSAVFLRVFSEDDVIVRPGRVPPEWFDVRIMGSADAQGRFADIGASDWISTLRRKLASLLIQLGIPDFDASVLQRSGPRSLTQKVSQVVYREGFNGIRYLSKYGHDIENWALFEPADLTSANNEEIHPDDTDLIEALRLFNLIVG